jgi:FtsP/CotA-like multicopper oxidase with cupredoxin domain
MSPDYQINLTLDFPELEEQSHGNFLEHESIEWEDNMGIINSQATNESLTWLMVDSGTNKKNMHMEYKVKTGDVKKIRILNDKNSVHPMQHPIHLHGQRFLVLEQDGIPSNNLAWKDTVLVPKGSYVDILVDFSNPGKWMMHCHIAEHLQSGMMTVIDVE